MNAKWIALLVAVVFATTSAAADKGLELAKTTDRYMDRAEALLARVSAQADRNAYIAEVVQPTTEAIHRWPPMGDEAIDRYRFCAFAVAAFIGYAEDQFKAGGRLPKTTLSAKDYLEQRRRCKSVIQQR